MIPLLISTIDLKKKDFRVSARMGKWGGMRPKERETKSGRKKKTVSSLFADLRYLHPFLSLLFPQAHVCYHDAVIREEKAPPVFTPWRRRGHKTRNGNRCSPYAVVSPPPRDCCCPDYNPNFIAAASRHSAITIFLSLFFRRKPVRAYIYIEEGKNLTSEHDSHIFFLL